MNMPAKKLQPAPINGADVLAVLDRRLGELQQRRLVNIENIIATEGTVGAGRDDLGAPATEQAEALINGEKVVLSREKPLSTLAALYAELHLIDLALKIGRSRQHRLAAERAGEIWASHFAEIAEIEKRRVMLALELQATNRTRERLREKISKAGGAGFLSSDGADLLGLGAEVAEVQWAAERLIADGICSRREIERATTNG